MNTKIAKCYCKHEYQDKKYGKGMRVFNYGTKDNGRWICTVCGKEEAR